MSSHSRKQRGNALFLILIAIALFAALSYAVTRTGRGGGGIERETRDMQVAEMLQFFATLESAVTRMTLSGIPPENLSFENTVWQNEDTTLYHPAGHNPNCTSTDCQVFHPDGGNVRPYILPAEMDAWFEAGGAGLQNAPRHGRVQLMKVEGIGTAAPELMLVYGYINQQHCVLLNKKLGIADQQAGSLTKDIGQAGAFNGDFSFVPVSSIGDAEWPAMAGQHTGAVDHISNVAVQTCRIFHVLLAR